MKGAIKYIELMENIVASSVGAEKTHDGGKGVSLDALQNEQKKFESIVFARTYLVPTKMGSAKMLTTHTKVRFFYNYRDGFAEVFFNEGYMNTIIQRLPAIKEPISKLVEGHTPFGEPSGKCLVCNTETESLKTPEGDILDNRCPMCSRIILKEAKGVA